MGIKVRQLVINGVKLTKHIVRQLNPIPIELAHYVASSRGGPGLCEPTK